MAQYLAKFRKMTDLNRGLNKKQHPLSYGKWVTVGAGETFEAALEQGESFKSGVMGGLGQLAIFKGGKIVSDEICGRYIEKKDV